MKTLLSFKTLISGCSGIQNLYFRITFNRNKISTKYHLEVSPKTLHVWTLYLVIQLLPDKFRVKSPTYTTPLGSFGHRNEAEYLYQGAISNPHIFFPIDNEIWRVSGLLTYKIK